MTTFSPATPADVLNLVKWAAGEQTPLEIIGHGSKRGIGRPAQTEHTLDMSHMSGVTLYEPEELVLSAYAGTPLAEIEKHLDRNRQQLAFEPMDYAGLLGGKPGQGTIGGVLATNLSGPRRLKAGAARDHILGIEVVSGRGEAFKAGGKVVKNVTGYDLSKVMAGSWGTLAALTSVTFKVLPAAETEITFAVRGLLDDNASAAMGMAMGSSAEISSAAHLPEGVATAVIGGKLGPQAATLLRLEGFGPSVKARLERLKDIFRLADSVHELAVVDSRQLWREIRDCAPLIDGTDRPVWRISMPPANSHEMTLGLRRAIPATCFYDWQGGLVWLRIEDDEPHADEVRKLIARHGGGHATLVRASAAIRAASQVFQPQPTALAALSQRLKAEFDPNNILNPGRMA